MWSRLKPRSIYDLFAVIGCFAALTTGAAYATATIGSADIIDGQVKNPDLATGAVGNGKIGTAAVGNSKLAYGAVTSSKLFNGGVGTIDLANGAITRAKRADPEIWHYVGDPGEPAFQNEWGNYSAEATNHQDATWAHVAFRKDDDGMVHLTGMIAGGDSETAFRLPTGYCPAYFNTFPVMANNALGRVTVALDANGCDVLILFGSNEWVSLSGIHFLESALDFRVRPGGGVGR